MEEILPLKAWRRPTQDMGRSMLREDTRGNASAPPAARDARVMFASRRVAQRPARSPRSPR
jgi:hypothetical protein